MPSFGHLDKTSHLFVHLTRPAPNSGPLRNLLPGISSYPQKLRPGGTLFFGTAKSRDRNLDRVPDQGGFRSTLKARIPRELQNKNSGNPPGTSWGAPGRTYLKIFQALLGQEIERKKSEHRFVMKTVRHVKRCVQKISLCADSRSCPIRRCFFKKSRVCNTWAHQYHNRSTVYPQKFFRKRAENIVE